jgi:predicted DCC family thiol-disulfide oxidoreductase YuxK
MPGWVPPEKPRVTDITPDRYDIEVFFDGACPLCMREMNLLRRWDRHAKIRFTDISDPRFEPSILGKTYGDLMARIYGRLPDGTLVQGVEVFRRLYAAVGLGPLVALSRLPLISRMFDWGYAIFARHRLRLTGRCTAQSCAISRGEGN